MKHALSGGVGMKITNLDSFIAAGLCIFALAGSATAQEGRSLGEPGRTGQPSKHC